MRLSAVEIEGFKSFAQKTRLTFQSGITAVIGPNGSGKSNVTEAIRWVLGEQSVKQLRGQESTDVIFHGTDGVTASRRARVTLTFDNESGRFPVEAPEISITRSLSRDGESHYMVNGDDVRLLDLQKMLAQAGVGTRTFTVISQGMVDRYLTATPKERKDLFDEATGVRSLQLQLLEAHRKLQRTQHHAQELQAIVQELAPRLAVLARQVKRYETRTRIAEEFEQQQEQWYGHAWHSHMGEITATQETIAQLRGATANARLRRQKLEQAFFSKTANSLAQELQGKLARAQAEFSYAKQTYDRFITRKQELEKSLADIEGRQLLAKMRLDEARKISMQFDSIRQTENILSRCSAFIQSVLAGKASRKEASAIISAIASHLAHLKQVPLAQTAQHMLDAVERPLQEVARLQAIASERKEQLAALPEVPKPSTETVDAVSAELATASSSTQGTAAALEEVRQHELEAERSASAAEAALNQSNKELQELEEEIMREKGSAFLQHVRQTPPAAESPVPSIDQLRSLATKLAAIGEPDPLIIKEHEEVQRRHSHLQEQLADVQQAATNLVDMMGNLHKQMQKQFSERFLVIQQGFAATFVQLFGGGSANIAQSEVGIEISVTPPGKRSRHVSLLSGGERALTSLALLMAILDAQTPPFIVLDEVDAALDEANSKRFADLLKERCVATQGIVVTHNREVMSVADVLYGVTMAKRGISSLYSVKLQDIDISATEGHPVQEMQI